MGRRKKGSRQAPPSEEFFAMMEALANDLGVEVRGMSYAPPEYTGSEVKVRTNIDTDFMLAHEMGHAIDRRLANQQGAENVPKEEKKFARRQHREAAEVARGALSPSDRFAETMNSPMWINRMIHFPSDKETRASLFASYLTEPDSVPDFAMFADSVLSAHGLSEVAGKVQESFLSQLHRKNKEK